jgi:PleD family two-component response regulator
MKNRKTVQNRKGFAQKNENQKRSIKGEKIMAIAKVLLVDDEIPFVEAMSRRLKKRDIDIVAAFSGVRRWRCWKMMEAWKW